ncbi:MAG: protein kinase domain-containing protein [Longimicrobiales bacterium]
MDGAKRWARVEEVFHRAVECPPDQREAFLESATQGDPELRNRVLALLIAEEDAGAFMEAPAATVTGAESAEDVPSIGPYRVIRPLGAGGMGEVFLAVEEEPDFRRYVAIKVVRAGVGPGFSERFARERAILAQLAHPGIAQFIGGGETEDGRPYFVMEHVEGERIDRHADRALLTIRERVELFRHVCHAVQHAHANLVVHRDLKPGNILVTSGGVPKLLDFGIAKLLDPERADLTRTGLHLATPEYAAPEQLRGDLVSTASDVYALGVLLYELLSGHRPYSAKAAAVRAMASEPGPAPIPSSAVGQLATRPNAEGVEETVTPEDVSGKRRSEPAALRRTLRGDLDNIVLKAMRPEPAARYVSAAALADDLDRYLAAQPVTARGDSFGYRAAKFVRRNRAATLAAAALLVTIVGAAASTVVQNREIQAQADRLAVERDRAIEVQSFLLESFGATGGDGVAGEAQTVRQVLDARAELVEIQYAEDPATRAEMLHVLADGYERIGALEEAQRWGERAVEERRLLATAAHDPELARSLGLLGWILHERQQLDDAEELLRESLATWRVIADDSVGLSRALNDLSGILTNQAKLDEAEALGREAMAIRRALHPSGDHRSIAVTANNLGNIVGLQGDREEALEFGEESVRVLEAVLGPGHRRTLFARRNVAVQHAWLGDWEKTAEISADVVEAFEREFGPDDIGLAWGLSIYSSALGRISRYEEAYAAAARGLVIAEEKLGDHQLTGDLLRGRRNLYQIEGRRDEALAESRRIVALFKRMYDDHPMLADELRQVGSLAVDRNEQTASYREAAEMLTRLEGEEGQGAVRLKLSLARSLAAGGRHQEALELFEGLQRTVPIAYGDDHGYAPAPYLGQAEAHVALGDRTKAQEALEQAKSRMTGAADVEPNQQWLARVEASLGETS